MPVDWNSDAFMARLRPAVMRGLARSISEVETRAVELIMTGPKTGRIYRRRGVDHQASAPGEAPASDTGRLVNSRTVDLFDEQLLARLTFRTAYALPLERGTENMEPRPYASRALEEKRTNILSNIREEIMAVSG